MPCEEQHRQRAGDFSFLVLTISLNFEGRVLGPLKAEGSVSNQDRDRTLDVLRQDRLVGSIRVADPQRLPELATALIDAGVRALELAVTTPMIATVIGDLVGRFGARACIGASHVATPHDADAVLEAGCAFVSTPNVAPMVVARCRKAIPVSIIGSFTPTEAYTAHAAQADFVGIFPASGLGPGYLSVLRTALPRVPFVPSGGITQETIPGWFAAGAAIVTVGSRLYPREATRTGDWPRVSEHAARFVAAARAAALISDKHRHPSDDHDTLVNAPIPDLRTS